MKVKIKKGRACWVYVLERIAVVDAADLEEGEVEPAGGGDGGGAAGEEESGAEGKRRHAEADEESKAKD